MPDVFTSLPFAVQAFLALVLGGIPLIVALSLVLAALVRR